MPGHGALYDSLHVLIASALLKLQKIAFVNSTRELKISLQTEWGKL